MKKHNFFNIILIILIMIGFGTACVSTGPTEKDNSNNATTSQPSPSPRDIDPGKNNNTTNTSNSQNESQNADVQRIQNFIDEAQRAFDRGKTSEAIEKYITAVAYTEEVKEKTARVMELRKQVRQKLDDIGSKLVLEPTDKWLIDGEQITGSSLDLGKENALQPSIYLFINDMFGGQRSLVVDAPIEFSFIKGEGDLTRMRTTDEFGKTSCNIIRVQDNTKEHVVRAKVKYQIKGYSYTFDQVNRDFVYLPPAATATILTMESYNGEPFENSGLVEVLYNSLKDTSVDYTPFSGSLMGTEFKKLFGGDKNAIKALAAETGVSYIIVVQNDCYHAQQVVLNGKTYNIYRAHSKLTFRIIRVSDGRIVFAETIDNKKGQGNTMDKSIRDSLDTAVELLVQKISTRIDEINNVLSGGGE